MRHRREPLGAGLARAVAFLTRRAGLALKLRRGSRHRLQRPATFRRRSGMRRSAKAQYGGTSGTETLTGSAGNDFLGGGAGDDTLTGLAGDDVYEAEAACDIVVEAAGEGTDTLNAACTFTLPAIWTGWEPSALSVRVYRCG